jgi:hypothetical protein
MRSIARRRRWPREKTAMQSKSDPTERSGSSSSNKPENSEAEKARVRRSAAKELRSLVRDGHVKLAKGNTLTTPEVQ